VPEALPRNLDLALLAPSLRILTLVVAVKQQDSPLAVGMAEDSEADLLDLVASPASDP
jgi:hypothetical protein